MGRAFKKDGGSIMEQIHYEIEGAITCIKEFCKEHDLFQMPPADKLFEGILDSILAHHEMVDPEFNEDPQDLM